MGQTKPRIRKSHKELSENKMGRLRRIFFAVQGTKRRRTRRFGEALKHSTAEKRQAGCPGYFPTDPKARAMPRFGQ
jgi:hypothetical protein